MQASCESVWITDSAAVLCAPLRVQNKEEKRKREEEEEEEPAADEGKKKKKDKVRDAGQQIKLRSIV